MARFNLPQPDTHIVLSDGKIGTVLRCGGLPPSSIHTPDAWLVITVEGEPDVRLVNLNDVTIEIGGWLTQKNLRRG